MELRRSERSFQSIVHEVPSISISATCHALRYSSATHFSRRWLRLLDGSGASMTQGCEHDGALHARSQSRSQRCTEPGRPMMVIGSGQAKYSRTMGMF